MDENIKDEITTEEVKEIEEVKEELDKEKSIEEETAKNLAAFIEAAKEDEPPKELKPMEINPIEREIVFDAWEESNKKKQKDEIPREDFEQKLKQWEASEKKRNSAEKVQKKNSAKRAQIKKKKKKKSKALAIILPIVIVLLLIGGFAAISVIPAYNEVNTLKTTAKEFLKNVQAKDTPKSEESFNKLCESTQKIDKYLDGPFFKIASIIPRVKKELNVANDLVDVVSDAETNLLAPLIDKMKEYPLTELKVGDGFNTKLMNAYLDFLEEKQDYLEEMLNKVNSIDPNSIIGGYIGEKKTKIYELVDSYHEATSLLPLLRTIIGDGSDRLYILAAQNSAEIRASGGFPGSMGTIRIKDGILTIGSFKSVYDMLNGELADDCGQDYEDYMFGNVWLNNPWDACFIPDFSKAGRTWATAYRDLRWVDRYAFREKEAEEAIQREEEKAAALAAGEEYKEETIESDCVPEEYFNDYDYYMDAFHVDGVISMTPAIIQMMLEDVGEIELSDDLKLDSTNATRVLQHDLYVKYYSKDSISEGSNWICDHYFAQTAKAAMKGFVGNFEVSKFSYYYKLFKKGIDQHIINIWMDDPEEQKIVEEAGAAGSLSYDENDPFTGIYFSLADPSKLGWYLDIIPEISEPVENFDGSKTYDVEVKFTNILTEEEAEELSWYIVGGYGGAIFSYVYFMAPSGGSITDVYTDKYVYVQWGTYHDLEVAYNTQFIIYPGETITVNYKITTPPGVETPLRAVTTPTLTAYRN